MGQSLGGDDHVCIAMNRFQTFKSIQLLEVHVLVEWQFLTGSKLLVWRNDVESRNILQDVGDPIV